MDASTASPTELQQELGSGSGPVVIDVREVAHFLQSDSLQPGALRRSASWISGSSAVLPFHGTACLSRSPSILDGPSARLLRRTGQIAALHMDVNLKQPRHQQSRTELWRAAKW